MAFRDILLVICAVGGIQSLFWGIYLLWHEQKNLSSRLLGGLFLAVGIRVLKSTLYIFSEDVAIYVINIGFAAHSCIGPFLYLYLKSCGGRSTWNTREWLHFIPAILIVALVNNLQLERFWYRGGYSALLLQSIIYSMTSLWIIYKLKPTSIVQKRWTTLITVGILIFLFAYFSNYELRLNPYLYAPLINAVVIYSLSFYLIKNRNSVFKGFGEKYRNINIEKHQLLEFQQRIKDHYAKEKPYLNSNYTLGDLSKDVKIPKHLLSHVFNSHLGTSFVDFTNFYRIDEATKILTHQTHAKIASVAFDSGFNSLSSFNNAFKKFKKTTPSNFKAAHASSH